MTDNAHNMRKAVKVHYKRRHSRASWQGVSSWWRGFLQWWLHVRTAWSDKLAECTGVLPLTDS